MTTTYHTVVVGGGIVGASAAYHLARVGSETLLVDRNDEGRATDAGAGILSPSTSGRAESDDWFALARKAVAYYPDLADQLGRSDAGPTSYARPGYLNVAPTSAEVDSLERKLNRLERHRDRFGTPSPGRLERLDAETARDQFPPLAAPERAFLYADAGRVDGRVFTDALLEAGRSHGLTVESGDITEIVVENGSVTGVETAAGEIIAAENVVVAGGAWTAAFELQLGVEIPVEPQRGQIVHLTVPGADTSEWPILAGRGYYIVPWDDGRVAVGATNEDGVGFDPKTTVAGVHEVLEATLDLAPGLADAELDEIRVGLRPTVADGMPVLGRVPDVDGAFLATGHGPTGLLLGPYSGKLVSMLVRGERAEIGIPLDPFSAARFRS